jgi:hypothetical protein
LQAELDVPEFVAVREECQSIFHQIAKAGPQALSDCNEDKTVHLHALLQSLHVSRYRDTAIDDIKH